jgi:hypothetical protein
MRRLMSPWRGRWHARAAALVCALIASGGCGGAGAEAVAMDDSAGAAPPGTVVAGLASAAGLDSLPETPVVAPVLPDPPGLAMVRSEPVVGRTGPGGQPFEVVARNRQQRGHDRLIGRRNFEISLRGDPSTTDACSSCHRPGRAVIGPDRIEDAHRYVLPQHPAESGTHCLTCHAPDDVERLVLASGERVGLDHAYRLCAQCHYAQVDAWAAGVHGKRLDGWRGRRVVMGCADCHDPHQPAIAPRMPFPGPQLPRTGRRSP